ncbi:Mor transcription activator family protein [Rhodocyclus tenuis]|uniref:Mor family transcriptional regulator n=1 Tax=Rhodocyclus tenuis TaxID=1066 RepID=A0A840GJJ4_RHOTE|nr:Mor transcription activator family protein [Rhodocyclus tenuis]MBB4248339.1 Mor family transcriptional regulator [Rhodocyclus tenuis]
MALQIDDNYPEILAAIATSAYAFMTERLSLDHQVAAEASFALAEKVRADIGGCMIYLSKGQAWELSMRDREIYAQFTGDNFAELARRYDKSEMRIRQIVAKCRADDVRTRQQPLL